MKWPPYCRRHVGFIFVNGDCCILIHRSLEFLPGVTSNKNHHWSRCKQVFRCQSRMVTSWNGNSFGITGPLSWESTGHGWFAPTKGRYWELISSQFLVWTSTPIHEGALTHWGRVTHTCVVKLTIIGSDNGLSPGRRQAIIWTNPGILLIGRLGTNFSEILIGIQTFSFKKMHLKMSSAKWRPFCLGLNVLKRCGYHIQQKSN